MWQHVRCHTTGLPCVQCGLGFPTITELLHHKHLHADQSALECLEYEAEYYTQASLKIHIVGKHGEGYHCIKCGKRFDSPGQRQYHNQKCSS